LDDVSILKDMEEESIAFNEDAAQVIQDLLAGDRLVHLIHGQPG
jgi:hypothetical protein